MKHVYDTHEIAHLWMHQSQEDARNPQGNFYFRGDTIYSYGSHFPIARHVENAKGDRAVLFTVHTYGRTTAKHLSLTDRAIPGSVREFRVSDVTAKLVDQLAYFDRAIAQLTESIIGPTNRVRPRKWEELSRLIAHANEFSAWAGYKRRWEMPADTAAIRAATQKQRDRERRAEARREAEWRHQEQKRREKAQTELDSWVAGGSSYGYYFHLLPTRLRINGDVIETSLGAEFPVEHARPAIEFIRRVRASGQPYHHNGHTLHLGHYRVDAIDVAGNVTAGCHQVAYDEVERIAGLLGV